MISLSNAIISSKLKLFFQMGSLFSYKELKVLWHSLFTNHPWPQLAFLAFYSGST